MTSARISLFTNDFDSLVSARSLVSRGFRAFICLYRSLRAFIASLSRGFSAFICLYRGLHVFICFSLGSLAFILSLSQFTRVHLSLSQFTRVYLFLSWFSRADLSSCGYVYFMVSERLYLPRWFCATTRLSRSQFFTLSLRVCRFLLAPIHVFSTGIQNENHSVVKKQVNVYLRKRKKRINFSRDLLIKIFGLTFQKSFWSTLRIPDMIGKEWVEWWICQSR